MSHNIKQIIVVKETRPGEKRVALTPTAANIIINKGYSVLIEEDAGIGAGFSNQQYLDAGAIITSIEGSDHFPDNSLIVRVKRGSAERELFESKRFGKNNIMMGFLDPMERNTDHIQVWQDAGLTTYSLDQMKLSSDDPKNVLAAMSRMAGRLGAKDGINRFQGDAKRLIVIGTGPAALSAAEYGKDNDLSVLVFGRRDIYRQQLLDQGIEYELLPYDQVASIQAEHIRPYLKNADVILTAARAVGEKAPVLIDEKSLAVLKAGAAIIDLSGEGGNVAGSQFNATVILANNISVTNVSAYPKLEPTAASEAYAGGLVNILLEFFADDVTENLIFQQSNLTKV